MTTTTNMMMFFTKTQAWVHVSRSTALRRRLPYMPSFASSTFWKDGQHHRGHILQGPKNYAHRMASTASDQNDSPMIIPSTKDNDKDSNNINSSNHLQHGHPSPPTDPQQLLQEWRTLPQVNPTYHFPTFQIPKKYIQRALQIVPSNFLASQFGGEQLHQRIKAVVPHEDQADTLLLLLQPTNHTIATKSTATTHQVLPIEIQQALMEECGAVPGPTREMTFTFRDCTAHHLLTLLLPPEAHPPPTSFETIGQIAHLNLHNKIHWTYRHLIGQVLLETLHPQIETCIAKVGEVEGPYRTYQLDVLAGKPDTHARLKESGIRLEFDMSKVYWCSRLQEERQRLLNKWFQENQTIADPFCGVGALLLLAAKRKGCRIWANDWNPNAVEALQANAERNGVVLDRVQCGDAYDFLMDLGLSRDEDEQMVESGGRSLPDHVVMNYPVEAPTFLGALRWWPVPSEHDENEHSSPNSTWVHVYTFARRDGDRTAEQVAVDLIADNLLPGSTRAELNDQFDCQVSVHAVRDVAPGKIVYCVSFQTTHKLLRSMQGDF